MGKARYDMNADTAAFLIRTYSVGPHLKVTFTSPAPRGGAFLCMTAEWDPDVPPRLSAREEADYVRARAAFIHELLAAPGQRGR